MQISKFSSVVCAVAICTVATARAEDNPAQAAARAALTQKLFETSAPQTPASNVTATPKVVVAQPKPAPVVRATASAAPKAPAQTEAVQVSTADNPAQAAARAALAQKLFETGTPSAPANTTAPAASAKVTVQSAPAKTPRAVEKPVAKVEPAKPAKPVKPAIAADSVANYPGQDLGMAPLAAPALPISVEKQEKLAALLLKYKADQVTPDEYQKQRAAILAAP